MILDATAGNRTMYETKDANCIVYIDIQKKLARKPTIFADCTKTPFKPKIFHTIFFDPPHSYAETTTWYTIPDSETFQKVWPGYGKIPRYYGLERYKNRSQLIKFIYNAQKEFLRILRDDGLLWLKWNDFKIPLDNILGIFKNWRILLKLYVNDPTHTAGKGQTYWVCMCKKEGYQTELLSFQS